MTSVILLFLLMLLGVLVYALATNGKVSELGRILFFVALLWLLYRPEAFLKWL